MGRDGGRPVRGLRDRASGVGGGRPRGPRDRGLLGSRRRGRYAQIGRSLRERLAPEVRLFPGRQPFGLMPQEPFGDVGVLVPGPDGLGVARPSVAAVSRFRGPAVGGLSRPPQVTVAARGLGLGLALLQPGELLGRSGFGGLGKAGERRVERPAVADSGRMIAVGRRDAGVGRRIPARAGRRGSPAVPARARLDGQPRIRAAQAGAARCRRRGQDTRIASSSAAVLRTRAATAERGLDPLRVVDVRRRDADTCAGAGLGGRARPGGPDREVRVVRHLRVEPPPPFFPVQHVTFAGADISRENGQTRKGRAVLGFLQDVARVVSPRRQLVVPDRSGVAQSAQIG